MGGQQSCQFANKQWQFVKRHHDRYDVYRNRTGHYAQQHIVPNNPYFSEEQQLSAYYYRYATDKPIVNVYDAQFLEQSGICSNDKNIKVKSEYIPYRLVDTNNLNQGQGKYILSEALAGFHQLHDKIGPFPINDTLIGFNNYGQVKVWHNPNFALNHSKNDSIVLMSTTNPYNFDAKFDLRQQQDMVEDIWNSTDKHTLFSPNFRNYTNSLRQMTFLQARNLIANSIANDSTYVPEYLRFRDTQSIVNSPYQQGTRRSRVIMDRTVQINNQSFKDPNISSY